MEDPLVLKVELGEGVSDDEQLLKVIRTKFDTSFDIFMGNGTLAHSLYIQSKLEYSSANAENKREIIECDELLNQILESQCASYVILGDSGLGKTSLGLYICSQFWKNFENNHLSLATDARIPIYIHLPSAIKNLDDNVFQSFFKMLDPPLVQKICEKKLLIIVDGYDEMNESSAKNIYEINRWGFPPYRDTKMLILSRNERLSSDKSKNFAPAVGLEFKLFSIQPFEPVQINTYIDQFDLFMRSTTALDLEDTPWSLAKLEYESGNWTKDEYLKWFRILPDLKSLAKTPLILSLLLQTLPKVVAAKQSEFEADNLINRIKKFCNTKVSVYDEFIDQWFSYQYKRLEKSKQVENLRKIPTLVFKAYCYTFGQNLAFSLISRKRDDETCGLLQERVILIKETQNRKLIELVDYEKRISEEQKNEFNKMFMDNSILFETLRKSCLVKSTLSNDEIQFQFFHRSIAEYFVALNLFKGLQGEFNYYLDLDENKETEPPDEIRGLNKYLLREDEIILGLADRLKPNDLDMSENDNFKELLFRIIKKSKELSLIAIMSSNSISILNIGEVSFSGMNLSWVQIPGANLSHSLCGHTDFTGANLSRALLQKSWLSGAQLQGSHLFETNFGVVPNLDICTSYWNQKLRPFKVEFHELSLYVGVCDDPGEGVKVIKSDIVTGSQILEFKLDSKNDTKSTLRPGFFIFEDFIAIWGNGTQIHLFILGALAPSDPPIPFNFLRIPSPQSDNTGKYIFFDVKLQRETMIVQYGKEIRIYDYNLAVAVLDVTVVPILKFEQIFNHFFDIEYISMNSVRLLFVNEFAEDNSIIQIFTIDSAEGEHTQLQSVDLPHKHGRVSFAVDPVNKHIAIGSCDTYGNDGIFEIRSLHSSAELIKDLTQKDGSVISAVEYSQDFKLLGADKRELSDHWLLVYETSKWNLLREIPMGYYSLTCLGFGSLGNNDIIIAARTMSQYTTATRLEVFDVRVRAELHEMSEKLIKKKEFNDIIVRTSVSMDGELLAVELNGNARVGGIVQCPSVTPIQIWNLSRGTKIVEFKIVITFKVELKFLSFVAGGKLLIIQRHNKFNTPKEFAVFYDWTGRDSYSVENLPQREEIRDCPPVDFKKSAYFKVHQNGKIFARGFSDGSINIFEIGGNAPYLTHKINLYAKPWEISSDNSIPMSEILSMCFHPVQTFIALSAGTYDSRDRYSGMKETMIRVWDFSTGQLIAEFSDVHAYSMCFIGDSSNLKLISRSSQEFVMIKITSGGKYDKHFKLKGFKPGSYFRSDYTDELYESEGQGQGKAQGRFYPNLLVTFNSDNLLQLWRFPRRSPIIEIKFWFSVNDISFVQNQNLASKKYYVRLILHDCSNIICLECDIVKNKWTILWSHCSDINLNILDLNLNRCIGLDVVDWKLLTQNGAMGERACKLQKYISRSNVIQPVLGSSTLSPKSILSAIALCKRSKSCQNVHVIDEDNWMVSAIENKDTFHVFLVLEGIEKGRRFLFESHLRFYNRVNEVFFIINAIEDLEEFRDIHKSCKVKQWNLRKKNGLELIDNILKDYQTSLEYTKLKLNCIKWSKRKLKNIGFRFKSRPWDCLVVLPSALLDRKTRNVPEHVPTHADSEDA